MRRLRVLLCDDHVLILEGIKAVLEQHYDVVGLAADGNSCIQEAQRLNPDVVVLDVGMPILNGLDAGQEIRKLQPSTKLVFLSMHRNPIYVRRAFSAGGSAYVLKSETAHKLVEAIDRAANGGSYISPELQSEAYEEGRHAPMRNAETASQLTAKQRQILQLIAEGKQNKEMAEILKISIKTVEFHRSRLLRRLGVRSVAELIRVALAEAIIAPTAEQGPAFSVAKV